MKYQALALLATLSLAAVSNAHAGPGGPGGLFGPGGFRGPGMMIEHMIDYLELDGTQRDAVRNIVDAAKPEVEALREQGKANRQAIEALDPADPAYSVTLNEIALSNGELATKGTLLFTRIRTEVNAVLTDEQRAKLARGKERMRERLERRPRRS